MEIIVTKDTVKRIPKVGEFYRHKGQAPVFMRIMDNIGETAFPFHDDRENDRKNVIYGIVIVAGTKSVGDIVWTSLPSELDVFTCTKMELTQYDS